MTLAVEAESDRARSSRRNRLDAIVTPIGKAGEERGSMLGSHDDLDPVARFRLFDVTEEDMERQCAVGADRRDNRTVDDAGDGPQDGRSGCRNRRRLSVHRTNTS